MARRSPPDRIYQIRCIATLRRLEGEGELPERAEALLTAWEFETAEDGLECEGDGWRTPGDGSKLVIL